MGRGGRPRLSRCNSRVCWCPPSGRGVLAIGSVSFPGRPGPVSLHVLSRGGAGVLDESIHFIEGRPVNPEDDSYYDLPVRSRDSATLYQHCVRAIEKGLSFGVHGLPLMGSGDWKDGMTLVGMQGKGESVRLGCFLYRGSLRFPPLPPSHLPARYCLSTRHRPLPPRLLPRLPCPWPTPACTAAGCSLSRRFPPLVLPSDRRWRSA